MTTTWHASFGPAPVDSHSVCLELEEALKRDWTIHIDRLCAVTWGFFAQTGRGSAYLYYHNSEPGVAYERRTLQIGRMSDVDPAALKPVYKAIRKALRSSQLRYYTLNYPTFSSIWPLEHLRGFEITTRKFKMLSCHCSQFEESPAPAVLDLERFSMVSDMLREWTKWREEKEMYKNAGPKRKIDDNTGPSKAARSVVEEVPDIE